MKIVGVIPARYQSSRFPGKPLANICGRPMIWWVYHQAKKAKSLDELYVATDDERICHVCEEYNINFVFTSNIHKTGADRVAEVAMKTDGDIYLNIQGDEPLIEEFAIEEIIKYKMSSDDKYVGMKSFIENKSIADPNVVKVVTDLSGYALYFSRSAIPYNIDNSCVYRCMGLYAYDRSLLLNFISWKQSKLELGEKGVEMLRAMEHGIKIRMYDTKWNSIGVDLPEHIQMIESIMKKRGINCD
jgi:3-deoxy-manno-octulosonate cytidylyltransferase (CMP-KDO synthetase)|nr:3-deoxy-manno-octulosonate cytidylyltransferase [uncultured Schaedlerella sp.]